MGKEIERKFLVAGDYKAYARSSHRIIQGYLSSVPERTVRVRLKDNIGFITVKNAVEEGHITRFEWDKEIEAEEAEELLKMCESGVIEKVRYMVPVGNHCYEVDEFLGDNYGLVIAEIELQSENEEFDKPLWLGEEVTSDVRYYNSYLSKCPYKKW